MPREAAGVPAISERILEPPETTLLDLLDRLLDKGVVATGDLMLGVAGVDLVYVRLSALVCAADRVLPRTARQPRRRAGARDRGSTVTKRRPPKPSVARRSPRRRRKHRTSPAVEVVTPAQLRALRAEIERRATPARWNANPEEVQKSVAQLVLTIVEFLRHLMERQAIRRMEQKTLSRSRSKRSARR